MRLDKFGRPFRKIKTQDPFCYALLCKILPPRNHIRCAPTPHLHSEELNERMQQETVSASSGCGSVNVSMTGTGHVQSVKIEGELTGHELEQAIQTKTASLQQELLAQRRWLVVELLFLQLLL